MKLLSDRIKEVRKKLGMNQEELGDILGCSDGKIKGWEQGKTKTMKPRDIILLTNKYGFNYDWLESGEGEMMQEKGDLLLKEISVTNALLNGSGSIPYYKDINASAGHGITNYESSVSYLSIPSDILTIDSNALEAIRVDGNSMSPTIDDEDIIFIDKNDTVPKDGKIYVVYLCEEVYVKRIFIEPKSKHITLQSDNPIFPNIEPDCDDFKIIGRVIASMNMVKL